jgi:hypothetical protein
MMALLELLDAKEREVDMLEATLAEVLPAVSVAKLAKLPDELLRKFSLPSGPQDGRSFCSRDFFVVEILYSRSIA